MSETYVAPEKDTHQRDALGIPHRDTLGTRMPQNGALQMVQDHGYSLKMNMAETEVMDPKMKEEAMMPMVKETGRSRPRSKMNTPTMM